MLLYRSVLYRIIIRIFLRTLRGEESHIVKCQYDHVCGKNDIQVITTKYELLNIIC